MRSLPDSPSPVPEQSKLSSRDKDKKKMEERQRPKKSSPIGMKPQRVAKGGKRDKDRAAKDQSAAAPAEASKADSKKVLIC